MVVSPDPYRVSFVRPDGSKMDGPVIPFDRIRVTEAEKAELQALLRVPAARTAPMPRT